MVVIGWDEEIGEKIKGGRAVNGWDRDVGKEGLIYWYKF